MNKLEVRELLVEPLTKYAMEKIDKELEILNILKQHLFVETMDNETTIKIKEWLENEQDVKDCTCNPSINTCH